MPTKTSDAKLTDLFLDMLAAEQGAGDNPLDAYRHALTDFSEFLGRSGRNFAGAETQALRDYLADLDGRGFKSSSVARRLSAMRHLFRFLLKERIRSDDPSPSLARPQRGLRGVRLYCLLEVLYATGLRVSELVALPRSAAQRDARMIVVRGKGDKERLVPLNEASRQAMADYLAGVEALRQGREKKGATTNRLFPSL